ncbi:DUF4303 domain-containing protein [Microbacterium aquilitoris]|uniref:DUF4303 domain-containing protein n=1 Tax=Microbacterium aquilitoris TaxID=3067307 RepID=A0ABU3GJ33_9MICO|nr:MULTISPECIES: DUF4303 domain-containing protein [unclassified Microbacterium]MDT3330714.1 DUF4303 domain-containing protein [Microbacterium sp. KSW-18]MDT3344531.1 DUF4303 domain-containing protein [Microbacterium sp. KSW2-22]
MNRDDVRRALREATVAAFDETIETLTGERVYAVALTTDDGAMSAGLCITTVEHYESKRSQADAAGDLASPGYDAYLRWDTAEWRDELAGWEHFSPISRLLEDSSDDADGWFEEHIDALIAALAHLRAERAEALAGVTLFVSVTDSDETEAIENRSARELNPPELSGRFLSRYET